jgi:diguanylate cyclase (GGDEF)-like protein
VRPEQLISVLARFATTFAWGASTRDVVEHVATQLGALLPDAGVGLLLANGDGHRTHLVASDDPTLRRLEGVPLALGEGPGLTAHRTGRHVAVTELAADRTMPAFSRTALRAGVGAVYAFPLSHAGVRIGAIELYATQPVTLDASELNDAQLLADVAGSYVVIAEGREAAVTEAARLADAKLRDPLTSLPSRRLMLDRLTQAELRADRSGRPFGVLRCDIDDFRLINHRYGQDVGDRVLTEVAGRLQGCLRPDDTLARVGGDEFVVACEEIEAVGGLDALAERFTDCLRTPLDVDGLELVITVSMGCALGGAGHGTAAEALASAAVESSRGDRRRPSTPRAPVPAGGTDPPPR